MRTLKSFVGTVGVVLGGIILLLIVKGLSLIPILSLWSFVKDFWPGIILGIVISYIGVGVNEIFENRKARRKAKNKK